MTNRKIEYWVIPPEADAEFAANMDEQPVQLVKETRTPIEPTLHHGKRVDYEYERAGRPLCRLPESDRGL